MSKTVLVPISNGVEEIEAVVVIDVLRRASANVTVASVEESLAVTASRGVKLVADAPIEVCVDNTFDLIVLPGGMPGSQKLSDSQPLIKMLKNQENYGRLYAAICAAPAIVLEKHGLIDGRCSTCYPSLIEKIEDNATLEKRVVVDGNCVTAQGPGVAFEFALKLVELLFGKEKSSAIAKEMLL